jgi:3-dehydroquinate dehydratase type I
MKAEQPLRICIPIIAGTNAEALAALHQIASLGYLAELRLDYLENPNLPELLHNPPTPIIVTNRPGNEGGWWRGSEAQRQELLEMALEFGVPYLDVEARSERGWRNHFIKNRPSSTKIILSWHDFQKTPESGELEDILMELTSAGADIIKLVTMAQDESDNLRLLAMIPLARARGKEIIAFCMGPRGKLSRVISPMVGGYLSFATLATGQESAPGQLTVTELETVWKILT